MGVAAIPPRALKGVDTPKGISCASKNATMEVKMASKFVCTTPSWAQRGNLGEATIGRTVRVDKLGDGVGLLPRVHCFGRPDEGLLSGGERG